MIPAQQYVFRAVIKRVVDGDTIDADIDLGLHCHRLERLRLLGVNCPEMHGDTKAAGEMAKEFVIAWLDGADIVLQTYKSDSFGRFLANVWRTSDGASLNDDLISSGNAVVFT